MAILKLQDYNIYVNEGLQILQPFTQNYSSIFVLVDDNTQKYCLPLLEQKINSFKLIEIPSGEIHKNIETCQSIWNQLMKNNADRNALLINLGGGVIGDMGGFCASTYKRGIDFIQIPTTLLSQVDASIGGKLGIDFAQVKNSIGLFQNPKAVIIESDFLKTLPFGELRSGYAEIIKHSLISDAQQWQQLSKIIDIQNFNNWQILIEPSLQIKQNIVQQDPFEKGIRKALNFGHTIGHAVESLALETTQALLHGEAIAIGMVCESYLSHKADLLSKNQLEEITQYISTVYAHYSINEADSTKLLQLMRNDKKNQNHQINFTFLTNIGQCQINQTASDKLILESLAYYNSIT